MLGLFRVLIATLCALFRSRRELVLENAVLRHQLEVSLRIRPKPRLTAADRVAWMWLSKIWPGGWRRHLLIVKPETVIGWHRKGLAALLDMAVENSLRTTTPLGRGSRAHC